MHTPPPSHREDPLPTDPHTSTSQVVGTSPNPPTTDPQLPAIFDPVLESFAILPTPQQQLLGGSTSEPSSSSTEPHLDPADPPAT